MTVGSILAALQSTKIPFALDGWTHAPDSDYGVFTPEGNARSVWANGRMQSAVKTGTVDLFTRDAGENQAVTVESEIAELDGVSWYLNDRSPEEDTGLVHYEWVLEWLLEC